MQIRRFTSRQAVQWLGCGLRFLRKRPGLWLAFGALFAILALLLARLPIAGPLLLWFLAPAVFISGILTLRDQLAPATDTASGKKGPRGISRIDVTAPLRAGLRAYADERSMLVVAVIGGALIGVGLVIQIVYHLIAGPVIAGSTDLLHLGAPGVLRFLLAYLTAFALALPIVAATFYTLPLLVLNGEGLFDAMGLSFRAVLANSVPFLAYIGVLVAPFLLAGLVVKLAPVPGIALALLVTALMLPLTVTSAWCSYKLMFH